MMTGSGIPPYNAGDDFCWQTCYSPNVPCVKDSDCSSLGVNYCCSVYYNEATLEIMTPLQCNLNSVSTVLY